MAIFLFNVNDTFDIQDRGLIVAADKPIGECSFHLKIGDPIEIRNPSGTVVNTCVVGIEFCDPYSATRAFSFLLPREVRKADVETGAEVWQL